MGNNLQILAIKEIYGNKKENSMFAENYDPQYDDYNDHNLLIKHMHTAVNNQPFSDVLRLTIFANIAKLQDRRIYLNLINDMND